MSVALFDLGQRLRASSLSHPVTTSAFAPVLKPIDPIAVMVTGAGDGALVRAADASGLTTGSGQNALSALSQLGVSLGADYRTLVIADRDNLGRLLELARATDQAAACAATAAVVGWWAQRADHPGTGAVLNVRTACSARWVTGLPPAFERQLAVWRQWLGKVDSGPRGLLELAAAVSDGQALPGLEAASEDDRHSWDSFRMRSTDPNSSFDWRRRDNRGEAALGLLTRCDAAELYESLRLGDPLIATRESFAGTVVTGKVSALPVRSVIELTLDRLACRLRENTEVEAFPGYPRDLPPAGGRAALLRGRVASVQVTTDERLVITINDAVLRVGAAHVGQRLTLRPRSVDPRQQRSGRHELHRRYAARRSWLSGGSEPVPHRRDVPLDVVIGAAE